jgi:tetratricopeptide (TPR) repeat protein
MSGLALLVAIHVALAVEGDAGGILVMPLDAGAATTGDRWIGEAVAQALPQALARLGIVSVDPWDRLRIYEALEIPPAVLSLASSIRVAETAGASRVAVGTYVVRDGEVSLSVRVVDVTRGTLSAARVASGPRHELLETIDSLAWEVACGGGDPPALTREGLRTTRPDTPPAAFESYIRGLAARDPAARERHLAAALRRHPGYAEARLALGLLQMERGEHNQALETLGRVEGGAAVVRRARFARGVALLNAGRYREAEKLWQELEGSDPAAAILNNRAVALLRLGQAAQAVALLRRAMELQPDLEELPLNLAWTHFLDGDWEAAVFWTRGILQQRPAEAHARLLLTWSLEKLGRADEAAREWQGLLSSAPGYEELRRPDPTRRLERILEAERPLVLDREARSDAETAAVHGGRAERLIEAGDLDGALRELTRAAYLDPMSPRVHLQLARTHKARGDAEAALNELRMSLWSREDATVRRELVALLEELGRGEEARREAGHVASKAPAAQR